MIDGIDSIDRRDWSSGSITLRCRNMGELLALRVAVYFSTARYLAKAVSTSKS